MACTPASPSSNLFSTWDFTFDPCSFSGVYCDSNKVIALNLGDPRAGSPGLSGRLHPSIGKLSTLAEFSVVPGRIMGALPHTLSQLKNLHKPLQLPYKFTKVFFRHPGIFYISQKCSTLIIILRIGYDRQNLVHKHPLTDIKKRYVTLMKIGFQKRSRGLYQKITDERQVEKDHQKDISDYEFGREQSTLQLTYSSDLDFLSEEDVEKPLHAQI